MLASQFIFHIALQRDKVESFNRYPFNLPATHSPMLMAYPDAWVYRFDGDGIHRVGFEDTGHFRVMREFMANPQGMLAQLLPG